jgi:hypothetical protein
MKKSAAFMAVPALTAGCVLALVTMAPVKAQNDSNPNTVCLSTDEIKFTQTKDAKTILFQMRDGSVWQNTLAQACPSLIAHGSAWTQTVHGDRICANKQQITVIQTGNVCRLGIFTKVK